jgi:hypothetical protein
MTTSIFKKLSEIQNELKAPKSHYSDFGGYNYRSCEDILETVKPICKKLGLVLILSDSIECVGGRVYVKSTAQIFDSETGECLPYPSVAWAREEESKKGRDASQLTGSASSYARKYALNGLFCIDDTADADALNDKYSSNSTRPATTTRNVSATNHKEVPQKRDTGMSMQTSPASRNKMMISIIKFFREQGTPEDLDRIVSQKFGKSDFNTLSDNEVKALYEHKADFIKEAS